MSIEIFKPSNLELSISLPLVSSGISAGFPSPADDFIEDSIDLNKYLIKNKVATFYGKARGDSMQGAGIYDGDLLVIDRSLTPSNGDIVVCFVEGEFTVKTVQIVGTNISLIPANSKYPVIKISNFEGFAIWGVVTGVVKKLK